MPPGVAARGHPQEDAPPSPEESILLCNLKLLGVPAKGLDLSATMFRRPNVKALEVILYHCYAALRGRVQAKKVSVA